MAYKRLTGAAKLASLPAQYRGNMLGWDLDWRSPIGMRVSAEVYLLAEDLGGWETLSRQRQILVEKAAFLRLKTAEYETAVLKGEPPPYDAGAYSNKVNVLQGHLKTLGLDRKAKPVRSLRDAMGGGAA